MYGFKGISGRFAPIGVHVSLVLILLGAAYGALGGYEGSAMLSEGDQLLVASKLRGGITTLSGLGLPEGAKKVRGAPVALRATMHAAAVVHCCRLPRRAAPVATCFAGHARDCGMHLCR
jgi:hypothetical protein